MLRNDKEVCVSLCICNWSRVLLFVLGLTTTTTTTVHSFLVPQPRAPCYRPTFTTTSSGWRHASTILGNDEYNDINDEEEDDDDDEYYDDFAQEADVLDDDAPGEDSSNDPIAASKEQAISALSQPKQQQQQQQQQQQAPNKNTTIAATTETTTTTTTLASKGRQQQQRRRRNRPTRSNNEKRNSGGANMRQNRKGSLPPPPPVTKQQQQQQQQQRNGSSSSLLPPPLPSLQSNDMNEISTGLSSWEEFLGKSTTVNSSSNNSSSNNNSENDQLPSIADLFPTDIAPSGDKGPRRNNNNNKKSSLSKSSPKATSSSSSSSSSLSTIQSLDGVLPVSELFYRSTQALSETEKEGTDDEELPFSAEQSDDLTTRGNKIKVRKNNKNNNNNSKMEGGPKPKRRRNKPRQPMDRKMVRRGMEMLVGGVPINADPPQRSFELIYRNLSNDQPPQPQQDWTNIITSNSRDFGPLLCQRTVNDVSLVEKGLYCEYFVDVAMKWDICPQDLRDIAKKHILNRPATTTGMVGSYAELLNGISNENGNNQKEEEEDADPKESSSVSPAESLDTERGLRGIQGSQAPLKSKSRKSALDADSPLMFRFSIGVTKEELLSGDEDSNVLVHVLLETIDYVVKSNLPQTIELREDSIYLKDADGGATHVSMNFHFETTNNADDRLSLSNKINNAMMQALNDGTFALAMARVARKETRWPDYIRDRVVEECLMFDEEEEEEEEEEDAVDDEDDFEDSIFSGNVAVNKPLQARSTTTPPRDDIFMDGGDEGVFFDFSEKNVENAPFQGAIGPLLQDAAVQRALQRQPRVIVIGDVHGCIDELQALLRQCDYQPGDLVLFLGDLVCKGPDSISVVQMAREIGAVGVRGNHDFEVVRWHQAIQSGKLWPLMCSNQIVSVSCLDTGVEPPVVGSEHFHIASCLSRADMKWLYSLPWYIASNDLKALFVHAGFVAGIRLAKQNPRLMMNMRSILPDGTVTSKFFSNWPWARLWDGPQTVFFGHDADRGLQQYEHALGLDTGCVYGGRLTACILPERRLVSVNAKREYFKYRRKKY